MSSNLNLGQGGSVSTGPRYGTYGHLSGRGVHAQTSCHGLAAEEDKLAQGNRGQETSISKNLSAFFLLGRGSDYCHGVALHAPFDLS